MKLKDIIEKHLAFLQKAPRDNVIVVASKQNIVGILYWTGTVDEKDSGVGLQFANRTLAPMVYPSVLEDDYTEIPRACWDLACRVDDEIERCRANERLVKAVQLPVESRREQASGQSEPSSEDHGQEGSGEEGEGSQNSDEASGD